MHHTYIAVARFDLEYFIARRISLRGAGQKNNVMVRIATLSVTISVAVMIVSLAVIFGFKKNISENLAGFGSHIQITGFNPIYSLDSGDPIDKNLNSLVSISGLKDFAGAYPYAMKGGIVRGDNALQGVMLKGVDDTYDWSFFKANLQEGSLPVIADSAANRDVLISRSLADVMELKVGDQVQMLFIGERVRQDRFKVAGIYHTGMGDRDKMMVMTDIRNVQRLNRWEPDEVTGIEILTSNFAGLDRFTRKVADIVYSEDEEADLRVVNIKQREPMIFDWLKAHNVNAAVIITIMLLVALFNMIGALLIILLERTSMIGILKSLGMANRSLQKMFVIRSSFVILKGMFWGNVIGVGACLIQYYTGFVKLKQEGYFLSTVPIYLDWSWWLLLNIVTFVFIVLLLTLPTRIISLILPEKSLRFE